MIIAKKRFDSHLKLLRLFTFIFLSLSFSPLILAQVGSTATSTNTVIQKELEMIVGFDEVEKVEAHDISSKIVSMNPEGLLKITLIPEKNEIIFKALKTGSTAVTFKDNFGNIGLKYNIIISGTVTNTSTFVEKDLEITTGAEKFERLEFNIDQVLIEDENLLRISITDKADPGIIYRGLKAGKTSVTIRDNLGILRRKYNVVITEAAPSAGSIIEKDLEVTEGIGKFEKLDFDINPEVLINNESLLEVIIDKKNNGIIYRGLKPGKTTVTIRDILGGIRRRHSVVINEIASSANTELEKKIEVIVGSNKVVKINFDLDREILAEDINLLKVTILPFGKNDFGLMFTGLKPGKTTVTIKDTLGVVRRKYNVKISETAESKEKTLLLTLGFDEIVKFDFDLFSEAPTIGNKNILKASVIPIKNKVIFKGLKPGRTSVLIRDDSGDLRYNYLVLIPAPTTSLVPSQITTENAAPESNVIQLSCPKSLLRMRNFQPKDKLESNWLRATVLFKPLGDQAQLPMGPTLRDWIPERDYSFEESYVSNKNGTSTLKCKYIANDKAGENIAILALPVPYNNQCMPELAAHFKCMKENQSGR